MSEPTTSWPSAGNSSSRPAEKSVSVMRKFLESGVEFQWPPEVGECVGNHCTLHPSSPIPLQWKSRISDKTASIDIYVAGTQYNYKFQEAFAVKTIREKNYLKSRTKASKEVENMRDLRYPHVAALLGTFMYLDRLSILIFPAAPCDLHVFLKSISREMLDLHRGRSHLQGLLNRTRRTDSPESRSSTSSFRERPGSPTALAQAITKAQTHDHEFWPQKLSLPAKIDSLRAYFVCLSQALSYIHTSDVRHKDIKPENILIDASGSVVLTDFGISRRFPKNTLHITNDKWEWTRKYASPEIMKGKKVPRDDPSDVFSLGCVFLEMATLILGRDLETFGEFYAKSVNESIEDAYHCNLEKVCQWIERLENPQHGEPRSVPELSNEHIENQDFMPDPNSKMIEGLETIKLMLELEPQDRPTAKGLWGKFKNVSSQICRDCDPRHEDVWKPTPTQKNAADSGAHRRRSMQLIPEEASDNPSTESREPQEKTDESLLSANYKPDRNSKLRRASSPHAGRNHPLRPTYASVLQNPFPTPKPAAVVSNPGPTDQLNVAGPSASPLHSDQHSASTASTLPSARRTSSHAATQETATTYSRSSSPKKRRPYSHSGSFHAPPPSPPPALPTPPVKFTTPSSPPPVPSASAPTKPHKPPSPPPATGGDSTPAAFHPLSPTPSLSAPRQSLMAMTPEHQEKPVHNGIPTVPRQDSLPPSSQIIIYDLKDQIAYVAAYAQIKGKRPGVDYLAQPLPGSGRHIEIGEKGAPIATVDLGGLGFWTSCRRRLGHFPTLYVLNFSPQPKG